MKAIHLEKYGNPLEHIVAVDIPDVGEPGEHQVVIDVYYSPVNPSDLLLAKGIYALRPELPSVIGGEGVGKISSVGKKVTDVSIGDIVNIPYGTFAWSEKVIADSDNLVVLPPDIDLQQASMISINPPTAILLLDEFKNLEKGDWIVLNAANSAVARSIITVAKSRSIKTLGIVRRQAAVEMAKNAGADAVLVDDDNIVANTAGIIGNAAIKVGLDAVGGKATNTIAMLLAEGSVLVSYAIMSGEPMVLSQAEIIPKRITVRGFFMYSPSYLPIVKNAVSQSIELIVSGKVNVPVSGVYKPGQVKAAIQHTIDGGKVLLQFKG